VTDPGPTPKPAGPATASFGPAPSRRTRLDPATTRPTFIVAAVIALLFFGSQILNEAIPPALAGAVPGEPVQVAAGVQLTPSDGWIATEHEDDDGIRLEKGVVAIDVFAFGFDGGARELARLYLDEGLRPFASQLNAAPTEIVAGPSGPAARFAYQGLFSGANGAIEGEVTAIVAGGTGVLLDGWGPQGSVEGLLGEVHEMIATVTVEP